MDDSQTDYRETALDPDILSPPFKVQTGWHVITGAPSAGKSTLVDQLAGRAFQTVPEAGRICIERELARGFTIPEIRENIAAIQTAIKDMQL
jgi:predicted ATPase